MSWFLCLSAGKAPGFGGPRRTAEEQLDYDMELLKAQREGREAEFKKEAGEKLRADHVARVAKRKEEAAARLDAEMDDYFKKKDQPDAGPGEAAGKDAPSDAHADNAPALAAAEPVDTPK